MATFDEFLSSFPPENPKGKDFERAAKWFLETDPLWRNKVDTVWLWDDWPGRWGPDNGIDLVFKDKESQTWAVQAKHYRPDLWITRDDIHKFIAEASRAGIDQRLLIGTTDQIRPNGSRLLDGIEPSAVRLLRSDLENAAIEWPTSLEALSEGHRKGQPTPDPHQEAAVNDVVAGFRDADRGQLIMACGTGKTYTTLWVKERLGATRTLVLLPSLGLLSQTLKEWTFAATTPFEVLAVCSDKTVGSVRRDEMLSSISDIPYSVEQDPSVIEKFLRSSSEQVIFCTYQSSELIANAQADPLTPAFDLIIADEAHRCTGESQSTFTNVLNNGFIRSKKRLFTTATPRTYSQSVRTRAEDRGVELASMDDAEIFGECFHTLGFGKAIEDDLLNDYQVLVVGVDEPMIADWIKRREIVQTESDIETDASSIAAQIGLLKAVRDYDIHSMITFHSRVSAAKDFSNELLKTNDWLNVSNVDEVCLQTDYVSGKMNSRERSTKIGVLKNATANQRVLLANCRCLSEGVDVPSLDGVAFIDPRQSTVDITQCVGRAIRKVRDSTKKGTGTIVIPVFIEPGDDSDAVIEASNFKPVWDVINALKAHDETLLYELDEYRIELGRRSKSGTRRKGFTKIIFDLPRSIDASFQESLSTQLVTHTTASWMYFYGLLVRFKKEYGHCRVIEDHITTEGVKLGIWVGAQRIRQRKGLLEPEREKRLDALGLIWDPRIEQWEVGFAALVAFKEANGHCRVTQDHTTPEGYKLGRWITKQRIRQRKGLLEPEREKRLDALGFIWDPRIEQWEAGFAALVAFKEANGHCRVTEDHITTEGVKLGIWVGSQRARQKKGLLEPEREKRLDALGLIWDPRIEQWEVGFAALVAFKEANGHCRVTQRHTTNEGVKLGIWVGSQRARQKKGLLEPEQEKLLDALGFIWDTLTEQWEAGFDALEAFKEANGHCRVIAKHTTSEGYELGRWITKQRARQKKGLLEPEREKRLDALGLIWEPHAEQWEEGFAAFFVAYKEANSDCLKIVKHTTSEGYELGRWITKQRGRQKKGLLEPEREKRLDALGFIWDLAVEQWEVGFAALVAFKEANGHCRVIEDHITTEGVKLGIWVKGQRQRQAKGSLESERKKRLDTLGFIWDPHAELWEVGFAALVAFKKANGHCRIKSGHTTSEDVKLGQWVQSQRQRQAKDSLEPERKKRLDALGFVWKVP